MVTMIGHEAYDINVKRLGKADFLLRPTKNRRFVLGALWANCLLNTLNRLLSRPHGAVRALVDIYWKYSQIDYHCVPKTIALMDFSRFIGWLLLNVAVPLLAPIALLPLLGVGKKYKGRVRAILRRSLQEGQLFWTVIAMCAAASYEAAVHLGQLTGSPDELSTGSTIAWTAIGWHIAIIIISSVLVLLGTMDASDDETHAATRKTAEGGGSAPRIMVVSIWMSIATAMSFTATHLWAS